MLEELKINMRIALRTWSGKIGFTLLLIQIILALYALAVYYPEGMKTYGRGTDFYFYYPVSVPPCWAVDKPSDSFLVTLDNVQKSTSNDIPEDLKALDPQTYNILKQYKNAFNVDVFAKTYETTLRVEKDGLPSDVALALVTLIPAEYMPDKVIVYTVWMYIERPDGLPVVIFYSNQLYEGNITELVVYGSTGNTTSTNITGTQGQQLRPLTLESYNNNKYIATSFGKSLELIRETYNIPETVFKKYIPEIIFGYYDNGEVLALKGEYKVRMGAVAIAMPGVLSDEDKAKVEESIGFKDLVLLVKPNCYGLMGTDSKARPIGLGILLGLPYAFALGFTVTFISTFIGAIYGTLAGYWKDIRGEALMRIVDVMLSLPFLPILIAISAAFGTIDLFWLAVLMILLSWAGPVIVVRSMALQISEQLYIEAAKAVGVPTRKIIFKHIFPQIYPYTMAIAVLSIPGVIVAEASLALLGFGDPQAPTWGKMLQHAFNVQAVSNGFWWMYIFPGLALVVFSATFLLVGRAIEPIVAPKLQK